MKKGLLTIAVILLTTALAAPGAVAKGSDPVTGKALCPSLLHRDVKIDMARTWDEAGYTPADFGLGRSAGPRVEVGDERAFWAWDLSVMPPEFTQVPATCRAVGEHTYVFIADDQWGTQVEQSDVDAFMTAFEEETPAGSWNPAQGIIDNDIEVFGDLPDAIDGDPRIYVLFFHILGFMGYEFDGYFNAFDQYPDDYTWSTYGEHSNEVEILYLNSHIRPLTHEATLSVAAHELQHMIHWGYDEYEESWVNESCSEAAMTVNGYYTDQGHVEYFLDHTNTELTDTDYVDYGACLLWGTYLLEQFQGLGFLGTWVADPASGEAGVDSALASIGSGETFESLFRDWVVANYLDLPALRGGPYGYDFFDIPPPRLTRAFATYPAEALGSVRSDASQYYRFSSVPGKAIDLTFSSIYPERFFLRVMKRSTLTPSQVLIEEYMPGPAEDTVITITEADVFDEIVVAVGATTGASNYTLSAVVPPSPCGAVLQGAPAPARGLPGLALFVLLPLAVLAVVRVARPGMRG